MTTNHKPCEHCLTVGRPRPSGHDHYADTSNGPIVMFTCCCDHLHCPRCHGCLPATYGACPACGKGVPTV